MKLSKNLGRIATTFLATAMLASVAAVPAFAVEDDENVIQPSGNSITINKAINMTNAEGAGVPDATFKFTIDAGQADDDDGIKAGDMTAITNSDEDAAAGTQVTVSTATPGENDETVYLADLDITLNFDTTKFADTGAGVYRYTFKEEACSVAGMAIDGTTYTLDVTVGNGDTDGTYTILRAELYSQSDKSDKKDTITNTYNTYDLTLDKQVAGLLGDKTKDFTFTVVFTNPDRSATSFQWAYDTDAQTKTFDENGKATVEVSLAHGEDVIFKGLPADVTYTITENNATGYTTEVTGDGINYADGQDKVTAQEATGDVVVDNNAKDVTATFTNTLEGSPATGIAMNVAPYILLVVVAGVACFFFMRKRRED